MSVNAIIGLTIMVIVVTSVFMPQLKDANTTGWSTGEVALWGVAGLVTIAGFIGAINYVFGGK